MEALGESAIVRLNLKGGSPTCAALEEDDVERTPNAPATRKDRPIADLVPAPAVLAELLTRMVTLPWPTSEQERLRYFDKLGLQDADESPEGTVNERLPEVVDHRFTVPSLPGVDGVGNVFRGELLGLSLFCYNRPVDDDPQAREAFVRLQTGVSATLGAPVKEWGSSAEPACLWRTGPLHLDMYCFQRGSSGIMVGPSHSARSAASDAAAEAMTTGRPDPSSASQKER